MKIYCKLNSYRMISELKTWFCGYTGQKDILYFLNIYHCQFSVDNRNALTVRWSFCLPGGTWLVTLRPISNHHVIRIVASTCSIMIKSSLLRIENRDNWSLYLTVARHIKTDRSGRCFIFNSSLPKLPTNEKSFVKQYRWKSYFRRKK